MFTRSFNKTQNGEELLICSFCNSMLFISFKTLFKIKVLPLPTAPHRKTFFDSLTYFFSKSICFVCNVYLGSNFLCSIILMKESIDDLTNQAIDLVLENDALYTRVLNPLKRKIAPYAIGISLFNLLVFVLLIQVTFKINHIQRPVLLI